MCRSVDKGEAIARASNPLVLSELNRLGRLGLLATGLAIIPEIGTRARAVQAELAKTSQHRSAGVIDLLTAATAEHYRATILHYDADFEHIASLTHQAARWIAPRGSIR